MMASRLSKSPIANTENIAMSDDKARLPSYWRKRSGKFFFNMYFFALAVAYVAEIGKLGKGGL